MGMSPPTVTFKTKIFHPNVDWKTGELCLDILKTDWSPAWTLSYVCRAVVALLIAPNADSPLNCDAGNLIRNGDERGFKSFKDVHCGIREVSGKRTCMCRVHLVPAATFVCPPLCIVVHTGLRRVCFATHTGILAEL